MSIRSVVASDRPFAIFTWLLAATAVIVTIMVTQRIDFDPLSDITSGTTQAIVLIFAVTAIGLCLSIRHRSGVWPHIVVSACAAVTASVLAISLAKVPFGLDGLGGDQSFRSVAMTRYSITALPADFGYRGLGTFMPPLWYWLAGRVAAAIGMPGWTLLKWAQIVTAFLAPALAFWFWRRVVDLRAAAVVAAIAVVAVPNPLKGEQWLSMALILPWWLNAFADIHGPRVRRWPAWLHGICTMFSARKL